MQIQTCVRFRERALYIYVRDVKNRFTIIWRAKLGPNVEVATIAVSRCIDQNSKLHRNWNRFASTLGWKCRRLQIRGARSYKKSPVKCWGYIYFFRDLCLFKYIYVAFSILINKNFCSFLGSIYIYIYIYIYVVDICMSGYNFNYRDHWTKQVSSIIRNISFRNSLPVKFISNLECCYYKSREK